MIVKIDCTSIYCKILRYGVGKRLKMFTFIHVEKIIIFAQKFQMSLENANKYARSRPKRLRFILPSIKLPPPETFENLPFRLKLIYNHVHLSPSPGIYIYCTVQYSIYTWWIESDDCFHLPNVLPAVYTTIIWITYDL